MTRGQCALKGKVFGIYMSLKDRQGKLSCDCNNVQMTHTDNMWCKLSRLTWTYEESKTLTVYFFQFSLISPLDLDFFLSHEKGCCWWCFLCMWVWLCLS